MKRKIEWMTVLLLVGLGLFAFGGLIGACGGGGDNAPGIPHAVTATDDTFCLGCHQNGVSGAPKTPHPTRAGCTGCHTPP